MQFKVFTQDKRETRTERASVVQYSSSSRERGKIVQKLTATLQLRRPGPRPTLSAPDATLSINLEVFSILQKCLSLAQECDNMAISFLLMSQHIDQLHTMANTGRDSF